MGRVEGEAKSPHEKVVTNKEASKAVRSLG